MNAPIQTECGVCHQPMAGERLMKLRGGIPVAVHPTCWENMQREFARRRSMHRERCLHHFECYSRAPENQATGGLPNWDYARFDNAEWRSRASKKIVQALERYDLSVGNLLISGKTGGAKTSSVVAWLHRELAVSMADTRKIQESLPETVVYFVFLSGHEIVGARRNWKLGEESPIIEEAKSRTLLIADEVGFEPPSEVMFEVLDARYRAGQRTIITTGLRPKDFRDRYGDALYRRIAESGAVVEDW